MGAMDSEDFAGVGLIGKIGDLQRQVNEEMADLTPVERAKVARENLRYIASVEPEYMGWCA
jgi:hypothetical protein